jgi:Ala-tRNA(Pro) deacylase
MDLARFLQQNGIAPARHGHPAVMTVEESERLVPKLPGAKTKNLFLRDKKGAAFSAHCGRARRRPNALGAALAGRPASPRPRLHKHLGITPGAVSWLRSSTTAPARSST